MDWKSPDKGVFLVNVLGIVHDTGTGRILIGKRTDDPYIKELSWCFPGGRPAYGDDLESCLSGEIKAKTGLDVDVRRVMFAKTYPEKREFLSIYYYCEPVGGTEKPGEKFAEIKWVRPSELKDHFTTSLHPKLLELLKAL